MFDKVIVDISKREGKSKEYRLYPFLYLIAEKVIEAGGRGLRNERDEKELPTFIRTAMLVHEGRPHLLDHARNNEGVLFTTDKNQKAIYLQNQGLTSKNAALLLAAAGLEITVPSFTFDIARSEEIVNIRAKLVEEREKYLISVIKLTNEAFDRLSLGVYEDTVDWALNEAFLKIKPKAIEFESAISKLDRSLLQRIGYNLISEGIPLIGSTLVGKGFKEAATMSIVKLLEVLCKNLAKSMEERKVPEVVYGYKVNQRIIKIKPGDTCTI